MLRLFTALLALTVSTAAHAAVLEQPANGGYASGIGVFAGWKCPPNDNISIVIDGGAPLPVPGKVARGDTAGVCGNDGRNGFIAQFNFGLLGDGVHTAIVRQNGAAFATSSFTVTTFGVPFLTGASGTYTLLDFPDAGKTATVQWSQGSQSFVVVDTGGSDPTASCPATGPIKNLEVDCSDDLFIYTKGGVAAGISSDGDAVAICLVSVSSPDVVCVAGPVTSPTTFTLLLGNVNGGPTSSLDSGSSGNIAANGQTLNFTVRTGGETFPFLGFGYDSREPLVAAQAAGVETHVADLLETLRSSGASAATQEGTDGGQLAKLLRPLIE